MKTNKLKIVSTAVVFILLCSATVLKSQNYDTQVKPYPAIEEGQIMTINANSEFWAPVIEASTISRENIQVQLDANPGVYPIEKPGCAGRVCCTTTAVYCPDHYTWHFLTSCKVDGVVRLDLIVQ